MNRREVRSTILAMTLGDGCLLFRRNYLTLGHPISSGTFRINHSSKQRDYIIWKAQILKQCFPKRLCNVHTRNITGTPYNAATVCLDNKRFAAWRKFTYPNGKKNISRILPFINNPLFALMVWLMDDGTVVKSEHKKYNKTYFYGLQLCTYDQTEKSLLKILPWFKVHFGFMPRIRKQRGGTYNKQYNLLQFNRSDALQLWALIRNVVLKIPSMVYKFRTIEEHYQHHSCT